MRPCIKGCLGHMHCFGLLVPLSADGRSFWGWGRSAQVLPWNSGKSLPFFFRKLSAASIKAKKLRAVGQEESQVALSEHEHQDGSDTSMPDTGGMAGAARSSAHPRCGAILQHPFLCSLQRQDRNASQDNLGARSCQLPSCYVHL